MFDDQYSLGYHNQQMENNWIILHKSQKNRSKNEKKIAMSNIYISVYFRHASQNLYVC